MMAATGVMVWKMARRTVEREIFTPQERQIDLTTLVTQVRELNRLETASMRVVHVGTVTQSYKVIPDALAGDELTFLATGDVIAGLDLSQMKPQDVWRSPDGTINVRLPRPEILVSRVDNTESRVLTRKTGMLRRSDVDLETRARQHAEQNIRAEALKKGILPLAAENGEKKMAELLRTLGAEKVRFIGGGSEAPSQR
jgi:Protein of unknown function (DUF4230)